jgi:SAM-dependent methyltransferase
VVRISERGARMARRQPPDGMDVGGGEVAAAERRKAAEGAAMRVTRFMSVVVGVLLLVSASAAQNPPLRAPDVFYVPTPQPVVDAMLKLAAVTDRDIVYDLGCGDGRIPITAALKFGARGVGIDIDPTRIAEANENAKAAGVTDKVTFLTQDLFESDISAATVVTLYLLPSLNEKLMPKLKSELKPGTRVVSHAFNMGSTWPPDERGEADGKSVYLWLIK